MVAQERNEFSLIRKRMEVIFLLFLGAILVLALRLVYLQWIQGRGFADLMEKMQGREFAIEAIRGRILDRNRAEIAQDVPSKAVAMNPRVVRDPEATSDRLCKLLALEGPDAQALRAKLVHACEKEGKERPAYVQLRRGVERRTALKIQALSKKEDDLHGLWLEDSPTRVNPGGPDGIQLIGTVGSDGGGVEGLELKFDRILRGENGSHRLRVNAMGEPIPGSETARQDPRNGRDVQLTLDRDIQHFAETELAKAAQEESPDAATAIVMDVHTGNVLAMANWPTYNPKDKHIEAKQRKNRAITDLFEPGSIFKVLTGSAALEYGVPTNAYCGGSWTIGKRTVHCAHGERHGACDLRKMIEQSCNITAGTIAMRIGPEKFYKFLDSMGIQSKTGIEFPGEEHARMLPPEKWALMRTVNIGFGQGVTITPIQLISAYAAIGNDGVYNPPRLVLDAPGANLPERKPHRVMTASNARAIRSHMEAVVTSGTGKKAKIAGYSIAGKTGTAQMVDHGHYIHAYVASFAGFVPAARPRLAILVSVWHPRKNEYGGSVSAPVFREIARQSVSYLNIPPDTPNDLRDGDEHRGKKVAQSGGGGRTND